MKVGFNRLHINYEKHFMRFIPLFKSANACIFGVSEEFSKKVVWVVTIMCLNFQIGFNLKFNALKCTLKLDI